MTDQVQGSTVVCPYCLHPVTEDQAVQQCPSCQQGHHQECWDDLGGCAIYGCERMVPVQKPEEMHSFWGVTEKKCPICAESIAVGDLKCPYCGTDFEDVRPVSRDDVLRRDEEAPDPLRKTALKMLILSALGVTSPFVLIWGSIWYMLHRREIAGQSSTARALILIALGVAALYVLLIGVGVVVFQFKNLTTGGVQ
jgi:zinc-ribbon domain